MKVKMFFLTLGMAFLVCACTPSASDCIRVYERGIEKVRKASTKQELSRITYAVKDELTEIGNRPGGDIKMSPNDTQKVLSARDRFYRAVELRANELPK